MTDRSRILLIDDNPDDRRLVRRALTQEFPDIAIEEISDAAALVSALDAGAFDVVVTDYGLRWSDGLAVLQEVRSRYPDRPVVMFTGTGNQEIAVAAMKAGLTDYVVKTPRQYGQLPYVVRAAIERRREHLALADAERRYQDLVDLLPAVIEITALDERATPEFVSPHVERQLGWTVEEWLADPGLWLESIEPDDREDVIRAHERQRVEHEPFAAEYRMRRRDGTLIWVRDESIVIDHERGRALGVRFDVTARHRLEDDLRQAQKMEALGRLAGGVAHDFNNLLTVIGGHAALLAGDLDDPEAAIADVEAIRDAAGRAASLTRQLLSFSRRQPLRPQRLDIAAVVADTTDLLRRLAAPGVALEVQTGREPVGVVMDQTQLEQILINLAVNASDAMPDGGTLTISVTTEDEAAILSVADTGVGMSADVLARAFEPFFTTKAEGRGTGLGLATVFGAVEGAGGRIAVRSAPDAGTTFEIRLPLAIERRVAASRDGAGPASRRSPGSARVAATVSAEERPPQTGRGKPSVLLVDDEEGVRRLARRILVGAGYRVSETGSGEDAVRLAGDPSVAIDLLLTDIVMPGLLGSDVASAVERLRPGTPVVYMSAFADAAVIDELNGPLLQKPFVADELLELVRRLSEAGRGRVRATDGAADGAAEGVRDGAADGAPGEELGSGG